MHDAELSEANLTLLVNHFYSKVRKDELIGPVFNKAIDDWPHHLGKLSHFWSSVMLGTGKYSGNPMAAHIKHSEEITSEMFERWLSLWRETATEIFPSEASYALQARAMRIAENFKYMLGL